MCLWLCRVHQAACWFQSQIFWWLHCMCWPGHYHLWCLCGQSSGHEDTWDPPGSAWCNAPSSPHVPSVARTWIGAETTESLRGLAPSRSWNIRHQKWIPDTGQCCGVGAGSGAWSLHAEAGHHQHCSPGSPWRRLWPVILVIMLKCYVLIGQLIKFLCSDWLNVKRIKCFVLIGQLIRI